MEAKSLVFSTGFVSLRAGSTGNGIQLPCDRGVAELYARLVESNTTAYQDIKFLELVVLAAKRLMGSNLIRFFDDQLRYARLDGMRLLFLEDTIKAWLTVYDNTPASKIVFEPTRFNIRSISVEQWMMSIGRNKIYKAANEKEIIASCLTLLKQFDYMNKDDINKFLVLLLSKEEGLKDLTTALYIMFGQEVVITHSNVRSAKNQGTQQLVNHLKEVV